MDSELEKLLRDKVLFKHNYDTTLFLQFVDLFEKTSESVKPEFWLKFKLQHEQLHDKGQRLYEVFHKPWCKEFESIENRISDFMRQALSFSEEGMPFLEECEDYWKEVLNNRHLFWESEKGTSTLAEIEYHFKRIQATRSVFSLLSATHGVEPQIQTIPLLETIQSVFDGINIADIQYVDEYEMSQVTVETDYERLRMDVLENIKNNIISHAFLTQPVSTLHFNYDNIICISCTNSNGIVSLYIANNGEPFTGDVSKLCKNGYFFGKSGHTGHGLYSAKETMIWMGGDLRIEIPTTGPFTFVYHIIIPSVK